MKEIKTIRKKVISFVLALTLMTSVLGITCAANELNTMPTYEYPAVSEDKATISFKFLGTTEAGKAINQMTTGIPTGSDVSSLTWAENGYIWIGVYFSNMTKLSTMLGTDGLFDLTVSLAYDSNYLSWTPSDAADAFKHINGGFYQYTQQTPSYPYTSGMGYTPHYEATGDTTNLNEDAALQAWKTAGKISLTNTNLSELKSAIQVISVASGQENNQRMFVGSYLKDTETLVAVFPMKMVGTTKPSDGTKIVAGYFKTNTFIFSTSSANGASYNYILPDTADTTINLSRKMNVIDNGTIDLFPASAQADDIRVQEKSGSTIPTTQYVGKKIDTTNLEATYMYQGNASAADTSNIKWWISTNPNAADTTGMTEFTPGETTWDTAGTYYIYVSGTVNSATDIDVLDRSSSPVAITVNNDTVSAIEVSGASDHPTSGFAGAIINFANLKADVTMTSGEKFSYTDDGDNTNDNPIAFGDFSAKNIALYKRTGEENSYTYTAVTGTETFPAAGAKDYYVISTSGTASEAVMSGAIEITGDTNTITVTNPKDMTLSYKHGAALDPSKITATLSKEDGTGGALTWESIKLDANIDIVITDDDVTSNPTVEVLDGASSMPTFDKTWEGMKAYVRVNNGTTDVPDYSYVLIGELVQRRPTQITAINNIGEKTYGDKLGSITITVEWDGDASNTEQLTYSELANDFSVNDIEMRVGDTAIDPSVQMIVSTHNGKTLDFYYGGAKVAVKDGVNNTLVVNKAQVPVSVDANANLDRAYTGTTTLPSAVTLVAPSASANPWKMADDDTKYAKITPVAAAGLTFEYDDRHAGPRTVEYKVDGTAFTAAKGDGTVTDSVLADFNANYEFVLDSAYTGSGSIAVTFNTDGTVNGLSGTISKKELDVTQFTFTSIEDIVQDDTANKKKENVTQSLTQDDGLLHKDDVVQISYTYEYDDITEPTLGEETAVVNVTAITLSETGEWGNYTLSDDEATASGKVIPKEVTGVAVGANPPTFDYQYPNKTLNLSDLKVDVTYAGGGSATSYTAEQFLKNVDGASIKLVDKDGNPVVDGDSNTITITSTNFANVCDLPYGEYKLIIGVGSGADAKTATLDGVTAVKKPISLADLTLGYTATYGKLDEATKTATIAASALETGDEVTLNATFTPAKTDAGTTDVTVELTLDGGKAGNYVLVDAEGKPITETTITGTIGQATYDAPAAPVTQVDLYNNTVLVDLKDVVTAGLEYVVVSSSATIADMDTLDWFTADEMTAPTSAYFSEYADTLKTVPYVYNAAGTKEEGVVTLGETYTVYVRRAADANHIASAPATAPATLYPYAVTVSLAGSEDTVFAIYTDDATLDKATDDNSFNENVLNGWMPSRFKAYFTDLEATTLVNYTELAADAEGKIKVYYTRKRTSSSSTGSTSLANTVTVTYDVKGSGIIVENDKNEKVPVGQSVAAVPTVTAKDGYIFRGWTLDGETVIDPATVKITEDTVFIALFEEVEETDPVIDPNYIDPYANGYPDGSFQADRVLTRGELAAMIARIHYEDELPDNTYYASFEDVKEGDWYNKYIGYVEGLGVMNGYPDGTFRPTNPITRAEFASVLVRAQKYDIIASDELFNDIAGHWAKDNITTLGSLKVVNGYEDGTFLPENPLTRGEAVTMINRILKPSKIVSDNRPNDIDGHWAEDAIYLAVNERMLIEEGAEEAAE